MPEPTELSCPFCLRSYLPQDVVTVAIPHHAFLPDADVKLCQECCAAVLETCVRRHEEVMSADAGAQAGEAEEGAAPDPAGEVE